MVNWSHRFESTEILDFFFFLVNSFCNIFTQSSWPYFEKKIIKRISEAGKDPLSEGLIAPNELYKVEKTQNICKFSLMFQSAFFWQMLQLSQRTKLAWQYHQEIQYDFSGMHKKKSVFCCKMRIAPLDRAPNLFFRTLFSNTVWLTDCYTNKAGYMAIQSRTVWQEQ